MTHFVIMSVYADRQHISPITCYREVDNLYMRPMSGCHHERTDWLERHLCIV
jgi:hypothetical protein